MAGLMADMPDAIDSGGAKSINSSFVMNDFIPLVLGTAGAGLAVLMGLGVLGVLRGPLNNVPVVGSLINQGSSGESSPAGWAGL